MEVGLGCGGLPPSCWRASPSRLGVGGGRGGRCSALMLAAALVHAACCGLWAVVCVWRHKHKASTGHPAVHAVTLPPAQVTTLGGSVTHGAGASKPEFNYPNRFFQLINASFPHRCSVAGR